MKMKISRVTITGVLILCLAFSGLLYTQEKEKATETKEAQELYDGDKNSQAKKS